MLYNRQFILYYISLLLIPIISKITSSTYEKADL